MNKEYILSLLKDIKVDVLAATKYYTTDEMRFLYDLGIKIFGENRVDSFNEKYELLKDLDVKWHFIGHLQRNKCKEIINKIDCLHSLDSIKLAKIINKERTKPLDVYVELKIVESETKSGVQLNDLDDFLNEIKKYKNINILGFMVMTNKDMLDETKKEVFLKAKELLIKYNYKKLSMGMSSDYKIAIEAGSTIVRLGRILKEE